MQRLPKQLVGNVQLGTGIATYYTTPANTWTTIAAYSLNNTSSTAQTVTIHLVPNAGSVTNSNQVATTITVPMAGAAPTVVTGLIGQTLLPGETIQMLADAATAITPLVSGYETTI